MSRRLRLTLIVPIAVIVVLIGGAFAAFALRGGDAPPPPSLSEATATSTPDAATADYEVAAGGDGFVGYRVREELAGLGVTDAVGRTTEVRGTTTVESDRITAAALEADTTARGRLTLHGERQPIEVRLSSQRVGDEIEVVGSALVEFADFGIEPPSVAGFVTVEDSGTLEFKLRLALR